VGKPASILKILSAGMAELESIVPEEEEQLKGWSKAGGC